MTPLASFPPTHYDLDAESEWVTLCSDCSRFIGCPFSFTLHRLQADGCAVVVDRCIYHTSAGRPDVVDRAGEARSGRAAGDASPRISSSTAGGATDQGCPTGAILSSELLLDWRPK